MGGNTWKRLEALVAEGYYEIWLKGVEYYLNEAVSVVEAAHRSRPSSRKRRLLLAKGFKILGEVCYLDGGLSSAIKRYRSSLQYDPSDAQVWEELADRLEHIGKPKAAVRCLRQASRLDPSLAYLLEPDMREGSPFLEDRKDRALSALMLGKHDLAWSHARYLKGCQGWLTKAALRAALGDYDGVIRCYSKLKPEKEEIYYADWFFVPDAVRNDPRFWMEMHRIRRGIDPNSTYLSVGTFIESLAEERSRRAAKTRSARRDLNPNNIMIRFWLAETSNDLKLAERLASDYPWFKEAKELARDLRRRSSPAPRSR